MTTASSAHERAPVCFISYSSHDEKHSAWVSRLARDLRAGGVLAGMDEYEVAPGQDFNYYMETRIKEANFVLMICTPTYFEKFEKRHSGVGYEAAIIANELLRSPDSAHQTKFVAILREGSPSGSIPTCVAHRAHLDFRSDELYDKRLESLLLHLHGRPQKPVPPIGKRAVGSDTDSPTATRSTRPRARQVRREAGLDSDVFVNVAATYFNAPIMHAIAFTLIVLAGR